MASALSVGTFGWSATALTVGTFGWVDDVAVAPAALSPKIIRQSALRNVLVFSQPTMNKIQVICAIAATQLTEQEIAARQLIEAVCTTRTFGTVSAQTTIINEVEV